MSACLSAGTHTLLGVRVIYTVYFTSESCTAYHCICLYMLVPWLSKSLSALHVQYHREPPCADL